MKILNGQQAFAELSAGKKIEARLNHPDHGFQPLDRFTATVFIQSEYEFRIAVTYMTIGEIQVPEPINEPPAKGTQCFLPSVLTEALSKSFKWKDSETDLILMNRGQVHLVQEHAETHALALIKISGGSIDVAKNDSAGISETDTDSHSTDESFDETDPAIQKFIDAIDKCNSDYDLQGVENNLKGNQHKLHHTEFDELTKRIAQKRQILNDVKKPVTVEVLKNFADQNKQCTDYVQKINACTSQDELHSLNQEIIANDKLNIEQQEQLVELTKKRAEELMPETETDLDRSSENISVSELHRLQEEAEKLVQSKKVVDADTEYENLLTDLLDRVTNGASPAEVNAVMKYTKSWTEDQRKPLLNAVHNRLQELNPPLENASLSVKIENAKDLTELDALEIDVSACDEFIQEKLMELIHKRRTELDVFALPLGEP